MRFVDSFEFKMELDIPHYYTNEQLFRWTLAFLSHRRSLSFESIELGDMDSRDEEAEVQRLRRESSHPIRVLYLDGTKSHIRSIERLRDIGVSKLEQLSMVNMRLTGLYAVPRMTKLEILDLSDNRITGNLQKLQVCPKLTYLNLSRNKIKNVETLYPLKMLTCLQSLDLFGNGVIFVDNYRQKVFNLIKTLRYLDGSVKETDEG